MQKIKLSLLKKYNSFIGMLLAMLGFATACEQIADEYGVEPVEYGTPVASFVVKGTVISETTSEAINGIQVIMQNDTTYTDNSGNYSVSSFGGLQTTQEFNISFNDVDGNLNGEFHAKDTVVKFEDPDFEGGDGNWDQGTAEKNIDIKLKPKE